MSATQTKGCPFPEEKGDHAVVDESMKRKLQFMPKAIHDRRSIHGEANSFLPSLSKSSTAVVDESKNFIPQTEQMFLTN